MTGVKCFSKILKPHNFTAIKVQLQQKQLNDFLAPPKVFGKLIAMSQIQGCSKDKPKWSDFINSIELLKKNTLWSLIP